MNIDYNFIEYALREKREQIKTATPEQLHRLNAECNGLLRLLNEREQPCSEQKQERVTAVKPLLPSLVEGVLLALEIPLNEYQDRLSKSENAVQQNPATG